VYRQGEQFRQAELLRTEDGQEVARVDLPIRYLIGSGHFTRSYLVEVDGFLHESPITWYASRKGWALSPGYDMAQHWSFERPITLGCLSCHAGRVEPQGEALNRLTIREQAIGCESCHGPGSLHTAYHRAGKHAGGDDLTIVNPGKLSRPNLEAVCAVCHLHGVAAIHVRGRRVGDYRPGRPLSDYRIDYRFDAGSEQMTVVGHIEQLRRSACYQKSRDLTCLTCHDPHAANRPSDLQAFYRQKCLTCHTTQACRLDPAQRLQKDATDNCVACHMPRGDTDIPHVAFTHHRIGRHPPAPPAGGRGVPELVPISDVSHLSPLDQGRNLGLAYLAALDFQGTLPGYAATFRARARDLLEEVAEARLRDGAVTAGLASIAWQDRSYPAAAAYAERALATTDLQASTRADTLLVLVNCHLRNREYGPAIDGLEKLTRLRRYSGDWRLLGLCYLEQDRLPQALAALQQAVAIRPWRPDVHLGLEQVYQRLGDYRRAMEHGDRAQWLLKNSQK
jgi:predicted CXXCH cytochrome family protein